VRKTRPATITPVQIRNIPRMGARVVRLLRKAGGFEGFVAEELCVLCVLREPTEVELDARASPVTSAW
jgi:hypothetical protein